MALMDSDIFILPSYSENFGIAVVEAMLCALPVILSNKVGISIEIEQGNAGKVLNFDDLEITLAKAIEDFLLNDFLSGVLYMKVIFNPFLSIILFL
jgi:glycosyltransferase involved in cell wall biosynthesis